MVSRGLRRDFARDYPPAIRAHPVYSCRAPATEPAGGDAAGRRGTTTGVPRRPRRRAPDPGARPAPARGGRRGRARRAGPAPGRRPSTRPTPRRRTSRWPRPSSPQQHLARGPDVRRRSAHPRRRAHGTRTASAATSGPPSRSPAAPSTTSATWSTPSTRPRRSPSSARDLPDGVGPDSSLVNGQPIDVTVLQTVADRTGAIGPHLDQAMADLDQVKGTHADRRRRGDPRQATPPLSYLQPLQDSYAKAGPLVQSLPSIVGADGPRTYLLAMLNPAEQRYSGGGALSFTTMRFDHGKATFGTSVNVDDLLQQRQVRSAGSRCTGNPFHRAAPLRVTSATFSPWWSVSGEELLRGYQAAYPGTQLDGVIGIDLQGLADVFRDHRPGRPAALRRRHRRQPGPRPWPGATATSPPSRSAAPDQRGAGPGLPPEVLRGRPDGGQAQRAGRLRRRPALLHLLPRAATSSAAFARVGLSGDLAHAGNDYLGVFTQNLNGSKADYWQHRVRRPRPCGCTPTAARRSTCAWTSPTAPRLHAADAGPQVGYDTRYLEHTDRRLPAAVRAARDRVRGRYAVHSRHPPPQHPPRAEPALLPASVRCSAPGESARPGRRLHGAEGRRQDSDTAMTYDLDVDPQDLVYPEALKVTVTFPNGWTSTSLPARVAGTPPPAPAGRATSRRRCTSRSPWKRRSAQS